MQDLAQEICRLTKKAYAELDEETRERFAINSLLRAIDDPPTAFYIREKNPRSLQEACSLHEWHEALLNDSDNESTQRRQVVKTISSPEETAPFNSILRAVRETNENIKKLMDSIATREATSINEAMSRPPDRTALGDSRRSEKDSHIPKTPYPCCQQHGHWARDCSNPSTTSGRPRYVLECYSCGQAGHLFRDCPRQFRDQGNGQG